MEGILTALERHRREFHEQIAKQPVTVGQLRSFLEKFGQDEPVIIRSHYGSVRSYIVEMFGRKEPVITVEEVS